MTIFLKIIERVRWEAMRTKRGRGQNLPLQDFRKVKSEKNEDEIFIYSPMLSFLV
jgi:hypothetical protein